MPTSFEPASAVLLAIGGVLGYCARYFIARESSSRKEDWDQLRSISSDINDLVDAAREFYCNPPSTDYEKKKIMLKLSGMIKRSNQATFALSKALGNLECTRPQVRLRQAITFQDDAWSTGVALKMNDPVVAEIEEAANAVVGALQLSYFKRYRKSVVK